MAAPDAPGPSTGTVIGWGVAAIAALWTALRAALGAWGAATARELAFVKGELAAERAGRERDRREGREALERLGARLDASEKRYEKLAIAAASLVNAAGVGREAMNTDVREIAEVMAKSCPAPSRPPLPPPAPRPRQQTVREAYAPGAAPGPTGLPTPPRPPKGAR